MNKQSDLQQKQKVDQPSRKKMGIYLYCLVSSREPVTIKGQGINDKYPLFIETWGDIAGVVSHVVLDDFTGPEAEKNLQSIQWIAPLACRHQEIVTSVISISAGLPTRFGTIFSSKKRLLAFFQTHADTVSVFLEKVQGHEEWSVKAFMDRKKVQKKIEAVEIEKQEQTLSSLTPGLRYFQEKKIKDSVSKQLHVWVDAMIDEIAQNIDVKASEFCELKILSREATGKEMDMIFNWAYLVDKKDVAEFHETIRKMNQHYGKNGLRLDCSGPWPPYSFCPVFDGNTE